jgi:hypothetical protein
MQIDSSNDSITFAKHTESDRYSEIDQCGFSPYVEALAQFLTDQGSAAPLTVSIEGEWGSGKSSFMAQLRKALRDRWKAPCVWFNAWRSHGVEDLIPAFSRAFLSDLRKCSGVGGSALASLRLYFLRYTWKGGGLAYFLRSVLLIAFTAFLAATGILAITLQWRPIAGLAESLIGLSQKGGGEDFAKAIATAILGGGSASAILCSFLALLRRLKPLIGSPFEVKLSKYSKAPEFASRYSLIEEFERDFHNILKAFAGKGKVFCFIDDIDRCDQSEIAALLNALNLLLVEDSRVVFIVGMDSAKIAAALASRFRGIVPYLESSALDSKGLDGQRMDTERAKALGREFIEKFIQIPFRVPLADDKRMGSFIDALAERVRTGPEAEEIAAEDPSLHFELGKDAQAIREICREYSAFLGRNPRRVKRFINILRLQLYIGYETGLFDDGRSAPTMKIEQVGKLLLIIIGWPEIVAPRPDGRGLLVSLQRRAVGYEGEEDESLRADVDFWLLDSRLKALLAYKVDMATLTTSPYSLASVDLGRILAVSERVRSLGGASPVESQTENRENVIYK